MKVSSKLVELVEASNSEKCSIEENYSYETPVFLAALLEQSTSDDLKTITPLRESPNPLCPGNLRTRDLISDHSQYLRLENLKKSKVQLVDNSFSFYPLDCTYSIITTHTNPKEFLIEESNLSLQARVKKNPFSREKTTNYYVLPC